MDAVILPSVAGVTYALGGKRFRKEILFEGSFQHPVTPWTDGPLDVTEAKIDRYVKNSTAALAAGVKCPLQDGHDIKSLTTVGWTEKVSKAPSEARPGKMGLWWEGEVTDPAYAEKVGRDIRDTSPLLADWGDGQGHSFGERVIHVALTPHPVVPGQTNFVALSAAGGTVPPVPVLRAVVPGDDSMKPTAAMHKALSIAGVPTDKDLTPESVEKMLGLLVEKTTAGEKAATELATTKTALETERVRAEKAEKALATGTQVGEAVAAKALSVDATSPLFKRSQKARDEGHKALLDAHAAKGRLTEPMRAAVGKLLSVEFGYALDATGSAKSVAVEDEVRTLLDAIPVDAVVPLKQRLTALSAAPAVSAPGAGGSEDPKETAKRMLAAVQ